ncbi:MAG: SurA N-terminal domain-containing protein [Zetaproteobacteria bacterium]|nr:SurA N-terminal domain-containing protein [Zetaproteobacteria bacterium]
MAIRFVVCKGLRVCLLSFGFFGIAPLAAKNHGDVVPPGATYVDGLVADVRGTPVLYSEVRAKVTRGPLVTVSAYPAGETDTPYEQALHDAINYALIEDYAKFLEIEITDEDVATQVQQVAQRNQLDIEGLKQVLEQQGTNFTTFREDLRRQILMSRFQGRVLFPLVRITESDLKAYYYSLKKGGTADAALLELRQVVIDIPVGASNLVKEGKMSEALKLARDMRKGLPMEDALKLYPGNGSGSRFEIALRDLSPEVRQKVASVEVGGVTDPIELNGKWMLFLVEDRKFEPGEDFALQKEELKQKLRVQRVQEELVAWLAKQRKEPGLHILAAKDPQGL